jgi:hypothetical protein
MSALKVLFDIPAVEGAFVIEKGSLREKEAPELFSQVVLEQLGRRLGNILVAHEANVGGGEEVFLRFLLKSVYARKSGNLLLGVICGDQIMLPTLRVASNICLKQLETMARTTSTIPTVPRAQVSIPAVTAPPAAAPPNKTKKGIWD